MSEHDPFADVPPTVGTGRTTGACRLDSARGGTSTTSPSWRSSSSTPRRRRAGRFQCGASAPSATYNPNLREIRQLPEQRLLPRPARRPGHHPGSGEPGQGVVCVRPARNACAGVLPTLPCPKTPPKVGRRSSMVEGKGPRRYARDRRGDLDGQDIRSEGRTGGAQCRLP